MGPLQLHGLRLPREMLSFVSDSNVSEQDGLGEGASIVEAITGLLARDNSVEPAVEVILVIRRLVCVIGEFFLWVQFGSPDVR